MRRTLVVAAAVLVASHIGAASQSPKTSELPYVGKWKLNVAKSDFGETTITIEQKTSGEMQFTTVGQSYTFRTDGKDYPGLFGRTAAWKQVDANTWETVSKQDGKLVTTEKSTLSPDGKTLTVAASGPKPAGGTYEQTTVYERVSGGPGLAGKWKTKNVQTSAPTVVELSASGSDGLMISIPDFQVSADVKFDGKDHPVTGVGAPPGLTMAIKKSGARSFQITEKQNGKALFQLMFTMSEDGKTLIEEGAPVGVNEKFRAVYDRQ